MFHVISLDTLEPLRADDGTVLIFDNGRVAAARALCESNNTGKKHQPRPIKSDDWRQREQARFDNGTYLLLPWHEAPWWQNSIGVTEHYAHVSTEKPGMISFTEDSAKGAADRQTRVRPGVYLTRFYADARSQDEIKTLASYFAGQYENNVLLFAETQDEIEEVYINGPSSCMSHTENRFQSSMHPTRVYAAGDLQIAYLLNGDSIAARCVCWPEKKRHDRIYGDNHRLKPLLAAAGYVNGSMQGARLLRIKEKNGFICPYIDDGQDVDDDGTFLRIGGDIAADSQTGIILSEPEGEYCSNCEEHGFSEDDVYYIEDVGQNWCRSCVDNHTYTCSQTGEIYARERNVVQMSNGDYWSRSYFENNGFTCENCSENFHKQDAIEHDSQFYCKACVPDDPKPEETDTQHDSHYHIVRQGRDESPNQLEIPLARWRVGDTVTMKPDATYCAGLTCSIVQVDNSECAMPVKVLHDRETWWIYAADIEHVSPAT